MATIPSLALIPSGYKASKVYSVLPTNGTGDFDFTRSGNATRVNSEGLIELVSTNVPRLNYPLIDGVVQGCPSLLLEPSRTNLVTYSEDFSNAFWLIQNASVILNNAISPDGTLNATKLVENASNSTHRILNGAGLTVSGNVSMSIFAKKGERNWIRLTNNNIQGAFFDLENGIIGDITSGFDAKIQSYGNGWYRCSISQLSVANERIGVYVSTDGVNTTYQGDGTSGVYIYGAQLESNSSYPTSYIPTSGTIGTRSAETCNNAGDVNTFNDSEGVLYFEGSAIANDGTFKRISVSTSDNLFVNSIQLRYNADDNSITYQFRVGNVYQADLTITANTTNVNKIACVWKINRFEIWVNGVKEAQDTSGSVPSANTFNSLFFGKTSTLLEDPFRGNVKDLRVYNQALNDTDLETLTSWDSFSDMATSQLYTIE